MEKIIYGKDNLPGRDHLPWEMYLHRDGVAPAGPVPTGGEFGGSRVPGGKVQTPGGNE